MKSLTGIILILFTCSALAGSELTATEKEQRKLVSRFYEALELLPNRCPESARAEYLKAVVKFEKTYSEFISLIRGSNFRSYAIKKFSKNTSPLPEETCLLFKEALNAEVDTEKGKTGMNENTEIMRQNG